MPLTPGDSLLHYRLVEQIGRGGMGVVWKAHDPTLDREVAIKVLSDAFAGDRERLARFEREAKLLASLNHPNVAAVYGVHETDGTRFLVMELVPGADLSTRSTSRATLSETLGTVRQIADALEAAHDAGIVHRDLKPANVRVRPDGTVKVLDFGLARSSGDAGGADTVAPTIDQTQPGTVLGTAFYMSPEQARGRPVDKRADIWALGCILYECLCGRRAFEGDTTTDVLAKVVSADVDLSALPSDTPPFVIELLGRCLDKDPRRRLRDAGEVRVAIERYLANGDVPARVAPTARRGERSWLPWAIAGLLVIALGYVWTHREASTAEAPAPMSRWSVALPPGTRVGPPVPGALRRVAARRDLTGRLARRVPRSRRGGGDAALHPADRPHPLPARSGNGQRPCALLFARR